MDISKAIAAEVKKRTDVISKVVSEFKDEFAAHNVDISSQISHPSEGVTQNKISFKNVPEELQERFNLRFAELRKLAGV